MTADLLRGFHGTDTAGAASVIQCGFRTSDNPYDWCGTGVYLFERLAPAVRWARQHHGEHACIVRCTFDSQGLLDLSHRRGYAHLSAAYQDLAESFAERALDPIMERLEGHRLDKVVVDHAIDMLEAGGRSVTAVRATIPLVRPAYPGSRIVCDVETFLVIRDLRSIASVEILGSEGGE